MTNSMRPTARSATANGFALASDDVCTVANGYLTVEGQVALSRSVLTECQARYNRTRPHQGIAQRVPDDEHDAPRRHRDRHRHTTVPPKTLPPRPDQRVHTRRLMDERPADHQPNPVFEWDTLSAAMRSGLQTRLFFP